MRKVIIAGNWKMNKTMDEAVELARKLVSSVGDFGDREVILFPPFTSLTAVKQQLDDSGIFLGAQDMHWEEKGAFTGAISPVMLKDVGCTHVIIGHSERRLYFNETDTTVNKKIHSALKYDLKPVLCVGEKLDEREAGKESEVVVNQVKNGLDGITKEEMQKVIIAYEPIWAIGTGLTASPEQAGEMHAVIRDLLVTIFNEETASNTSILYGGSVKPDNIADLIKVEDIDGALVGGASLDAEIFGELIIKSLF